jgi:hypothetical protein
MHIGPDGFLVPPEENNWTFDSMRGQRRIYKLLWYLCRDPAGLSGEPRRYRKYDSVKTIFESSGVL